MGRRGEGRWGYFFEGVGFRFFEGVGGRGGAGGGGVGVVEVGLGVGVGVMEADGGGEEGGERCGAGEVGEEGEEEAFGGHGGLGRWCGWGRVVGFGRGSFADGAELGGLLGHGNWVDIYVYGRNGLFYYTIA